MGRAPRQSLSSPAKKAAAGGRRAMEGVRVETLLNNAQVKVTRTTMQPGAEIPQQGRGSHYVIFPITAFDCVRRFMRDDKVTREVSLSGTPGTPYFGRATRPGAEFMLVNKSSGVIVFDKVVIKGPRTE